MQPSRRLGSAPRPLPEPIRRPAVPVFPPSPVVRALPSRRGGCARSQLDHGLKVELFELKTPWGGCASSRVDHGSPKSLRNNMKSMRIPMFSIEIPMISSCDQVSCWCSLQESRRACRRRFGKQMTGVAGLPGFLEAVIAADLITA